MKEHSNPELSLAQQIIEQTGTHLFLTGKAGTGKTTFLKNLKKQTPKRMVVLAPTGIAAINAGGVTIHSFFQLPFAPYVPGANFSRESFKISEQKKKIIRSIDLLVIDEISMVRADLLDAVDMVMRRYRQHNKPFGGVQLLLIGDLQQLSPVVKDEEWRLLQQHYASPYFFSSRALEQTRYATIELQTVYRQNDEQFITLLNAIREGKADAGTLAQLNARCQPDFVPPREEGYIRLVTHNRQAEQINNAEIDGLPARLHTYKAAIKGNFPEYSYPTPELLELKEGAQVMFVKNATDHSYYNGMIGEVARLTSETVEVRTREGNTIEVMPEEWSNSRYVLDEKSKEIREEVEGTFKQLPLKLAWAITIHKSQGLTFDRAIIDTSAAFAHGQTYVALSRCRTLEGLVLSAPIPQHAIINDATVQDFHQQMGHRTPGHREVEEMRRLYAKELLDELFDFGHIHECHTRLLRIMHEHFSRLYPTLLSEFETLQQPIEQELQAVAQRFQAQYTRLVNEDNDTARQQELQERLCKGAAYFAEKLQPLTLSAKDLQLPTDNKEVARKTEVALGEWRESTRQKQQLLEYVKEEGFRVKKYLLQKALIVLDEDTKRSGNKKTKKEAAPKGSQKVIVPTDILQPELYQQITEWRLQQAREQGLPAYAILQQRALVGIVNLLPQTPEALMLIPYLGKRGVEKYGEEILAIVNRYVNENHVERPEIQTEFVPKGKRIDTVEESLRLFHEGMSITDIAQARTLTTSTIYTHMARAIREGKINATEVMNEEKQALIRQALSEVRRQASPEDTLTTIIQKTAEHLKGEATREEVRFVVEILK